MKKTIFIILLIVAVSAAGRWAEFNPLSTPVSNQVLRIVLQGDEWMGRSNVIVYTGSPLNDTWNGVIPALAASSANWQWLKRSNNFIVPMTQAESNSVLTARAAAQAAAISNSLAQAQVAAKAGATGAMVNFFSSAQGRAVFAGWEATLDEINILRAAVASITNLPPRTLTQLTNAIKVRINAQPNTQ